MREMTRGQVVGLIRRGVRVAGSYRAYGDRVGLEASWLSQLVRGYGSFGAHSLRQLGLEDGRIVARVEDAPVESVPAPGGRPYRPMWRLGDWPSRYRVTEVP